MRIPVTKTVTSVVPNGEIEIIDCGATYQVKYHNHLYKGSPFVCPTFFSKEHSPGQIAKSAFIKKFIELCR